MDLKTYEREQFNALMAAGHSREHFKLSGAGIETWYRPRGLSSGADYRGPFVTLTFEQLSEAVIAPAPTWNGPEDGLPPIGLEVEVLWSSTKREYVTGKILAHDEDRALFRFTSGDRKGEYQADKPHSQHGSDLPNFRPIRTAEQLATEEREQQIDRLLAALHSTRGSQIDYQLMAALYDAGARMPVQP